MATKLNLKDVLSTFADKTNVRIFFRSPRPNSSTYFNLPIGNHYAERWRRALNEFPDLAMDLLPVRGYKLKVEASMSGEEYTWDIILDSDRTPLITRLQERSNGLWSDLDGV